VFSFLPSGFFRMTGSSRTTNGNDRFAVSNRNSRLGLDRGSVVIRSFPPEPEILGALGLLGPYSGQFLGTFTT
jgi:hypothetical protein